MAGEAGGDGAGEAVWAVTADKAAEVKFSRVAGNTIEKVVEEVKELGRINTE